FLEDYAQLVACFDHVVIVVERGLELHVRALEIAGLLVCQPEVVVGPLVAGVHAQCLSVLLNRRGAIPALWERHAWLQPAHGRPLASIGARSDRAPRLRPTGLAGRYQEKPGE